jgi:nitroreductase
VKEKIKKILDLSVHAPSGDNSQPWRFEVKNNVISIINLPDRDLPFYNFRQNGSYVAHGGLIENINIVASSLGLTTDISTFPDHTNPNVTARILLNEGETHENALENYITKRATNRKIYKNASLTENERSEILSVGNMNGGKVKIIETDKEKNLIGKAMSMNEIVALESKRLHNEFFGHIAWSEKEEKQNKTGLYIKTLEFPKLVEFIFRQLRHWPITRFLNIFGFARGVAKSNAKIYSSGAALGVVITPSNSKESYIMAGRIMQKIWLTATKLGLAIQPITGALFLMQRIISDETYDLSNKHILIIRDAYDAVKKVFGVDSGNVAMLFRIGHADPPSAYSSKLPPNIIELN